MPDDFLKVQNHKRMEWEILPMPGMIQFLLYTLGESGALQKIYLLLLNLYYLTLLTL